MGLGRADAMTRAAEVAGRGGDAWSGKGGRRCLRKWAAAWDGREADEWRRVMAAATTAKLKVAAAARWSDPPRRSRGAGATRPADPRRKGRENGCAQRELACPRQMGVGLRGRQGAGKRPMRGRWSRVSRPVGAPQGMRPQGAEFRSPRARLGEAPAAREGETTSVKDSKSEGGAPRSKAGRAERLVVHKETQTVFLEQPIRLPDGISLRFSTINPVRTRESLEII